MESIDHKVAKKAGNFKLQNRANNEEAIGKLLINGIKYTNENGVSMSTQSILYLKLNVRYSI